MTNNDAHQLGNLGDLKDGAMRVFEDVGDYGIVVCRVNGELFALEDNCSHADTPLSEGRLRGHEITCPLHGTSFDVRTGAHSGPPAYEGVTCYKVQIEDEIALALPQKNDNKREDDSYGDVGDFFQTR
tara:strand:+ start:250 stop:633 length:384 start_codon:yes stop_codon:yes gene_type:complete